MRCAPTSTSTAAAAGLRAAATCQVPAMRAARSASGGAGPWKNEAQSFSVVAAAFSNLLVVKGSGLGLEKMEASCAHPGG